MAAVTYSHGVVHVDIPFDAPHAGAGQLTIEILDPDDQVLGHLQREANVAAGKGSWQADVKLTKALSADDLVWHRLRYRFVYYRGETIEGTDSISEILRRPVIHILGQQSYMTGAPAAIRVVVSDANNEAIAGASSLHIELSGKTLFTGPLNARGTTEAQFRFPVGVTGSLPLRYVVDTPIGSTEFTQQIRVENKVSVLLTTEKPIYQPGQTIHVRALALDRANHEAAATRKLTFEVEDSRGNKVFKKATQTDKFGVASAEFGLADEVNLGTYHLRALMDAGDKTAEIALNVEQYVLPKFKVAVDIAGSKRGYRPGEHVTGTVRSNYFFGKAVDGAEVAVKATGIDVTQFEVGAVQGKSNGQGEYRFDIQLPKYFAGRPLSQGAARVLIEATVKDTADHSETRGEPVTVSENPFLITAVPEGGTLARNLDNQVFVLTSYPDGTPAPADLRVRAVGNAEQRVSTDEGGVAIVHIQTNGGEQKLEIEATDKQGNRASSSLRLDVRDGTDQILLRTDRAVYRAGDRMPLRVLSTKQRGTAYIDVVKDGQTVLTRDVDIVNGQAELALTATPDLAGTLDINAYMFGSDARPSADHRLVFVQPADELKIEATASAAIYKPGDDAQVRFRVTNSHGEGVQAALGLQVVDEAVFALAEKQPGFAKVFFYLEQEAMKPRYEIHSFGLPDLVTKLDQRDRAARALFSATEMVNRNRFQTEIGRKVSQVKYGEYFNQYNSRFQGQVRELAAALGKAYTQNSEGGDLSLVCARVSHEGAPETRDAWGNSVRVERVPWGRTNFYLVRSAGPDKRFDSGDDLTSYLEVRTDKVMGHPTAGTVEVKIEHDRGPFNGKAEVAGSVSDQTGAGLRGASVRLREVSSGSERTASTDVTGQFSLAALPAGEYEVRVSVPGFQIAKRKLTLNVRDRAVLTATLKVEMVNQDVVVQGDFLAGMHFDAVRAPGAARMMMAMAPPVPAAPMAKKAMSTATIVKEAPAPSARVRSYFPEALYINPGIITDAEGRASVTIPMADSITTWRMAMMASTTHGALGSGTSSLKVFQDFFVDLDLPVTLTQGDRVSIPVAAYNYSGARGEIDLKLQNDAWFQLVDDVGEKQVAVESGRVGGAQFTLEAKRIGKFKLTLAASMKGHADTVVREIEVIPNGREQTQVFNGRLENTVQHEVSFPAASIADASKILVRLYPGPLSQVVEGMDAILRMPFGCFEQTSSATYPNVLALDYMKRINKLTPGVHAKAEGFIANGYQRLLTFEVPGGGFSWFGRAPANKILTAYGLMEFFDMSKVHDVDAKLIQRTQQWLASQQQADGSWKPDTEFINEGATNRYNTDVMRITGYIAWSLQNTGYQGAAVEKARQYIAQHMGGKADTYTLAVLANFAVDYGKDRAFTRQAMQSLLDARTEKDDQAWWTAEETSVYARGESATVETTGLAVQALLKWGEASGTVRKALGYIASKKDANGTWGTTQATIMALRALLLSTEKGAADVRGTVEVTLNGKSVQQFTLTPENNDLMHQFVLSGIDAKANHVGIRFNGKGGLAYQVVGRYFIPWTEKNAKEALSIDVAYDRTRLAQDDIAKATVTVKNNLDKTANMVMIDLGIPPGFDLLSEDLQTYQEKDGHLQKFSLTATQAILYFDSIGARSTVTVKFRLRAKYPIRARTLVSRVYEYYDPSVSSVARPVELEVRKR
jgi:uncharacterized protein YfaS (alpha-2-macroglobulin family)